MGKENVATFAKIRENDPVKFMKLEDWLAGAEKAFRMLSLMGRRKLR